MNGSPVKVREQQRFEEIKLENMPKLISLKKKMEGMLYIFKLKTIFIQF